MKKLFAASLLFFGTSAVAGELNGIWLNNSGVKSLEQERASQAHDQFAQALAEMPFSAAVHYNLGNSYLANKEFEKAAKEFEIATDLASRTGDKEMQFSSLFNAAISATAEKQVDKALDFYQRALAIKPDSVEVKTNIELLTRSQKGGGGEGEQDQQQQSEQGGDRQQKQNQQPQEIQNKPQPKPFKSEEMSQQDVNRIVEELKRQEEQIRAKFQSDKVKSAPNQKDW